MFEHPEGRDKEDEETESKAVSKRGGLAFHSADDAEEYCNTTDRTE
ncbi:hypothetical protein GCM10027068_46290 [Prescottella soli]